MARTSSIRANRGSAKCGDGPTANRRCGLPAPRWSMPRRRAV